MANQMVLMDQDPPFDWRPDWARWPEMLALALAYALSTALAEGLAGNPGGVSPLQPGPGVAMAIVLLRGPRIWPGLWLGAVLGESAMPPYDPTHSVSPQLLVATLWFGVVTSLEILLPAWLIRRMTGTLNPFGGVRSVLIFTAFAVTLAPIFGNTLELAGSWIAKPQPLADSLADWVAWTIADGTGILIITPFLFAIRELTAIHLKGPRRLLELLAALALLTWLSTSEFQSHQTTPLSPTHFWILYSTLPVLVFCVLRFGLPGAALAIAVIAITSISKVISTNQSLPAQELADSLLHLDGFLAIVSLSALMLLGAIREREQAEEDLRQSQSSLEQTVAERTAALERVNRTLQDQTERLRQAQQMARVGYWDWFPAEGRIRWSAGLARILGREVATGEGSIGAFLEGIAAADWEPLRAALDRTREFGVPLDMDYRIRTDSGEERYIHIQGRRGDIADGDPNRITGTAQDITLRKQAEAAIEEYTKRLADAEQLALMGHWTWEPETGDGYWSDGCYRIFGLPPRPGSPSVNEFITLVHPNDRRAMIEERARLAETGGQSERTFRAIRPDGSLRTVLARIQARTDSNGAVTALVGIMHDITDTQEAQRALRESEERYALAVQGSRDGIWDFDIKSGLARVSPQFLTMLGHTREQAERLSHEPRSIKAWVRQIHPQDRSETLRLFLDHLSGKAEKFEATFRLRDNDDDWRWVLSRARALCDDRGRPYRVVGVHTDVTQIKTLEAALRIAKDRAEEGSQAKSRYLAAASHDLRQPLQALNLFVEVLTMRDLDPDSTEIVHRIDDSLGALESLINSLLDMSKLEAGLIETEVRTFGLEPLMRRLAEEFEPQAAAKDLTLVWVPSSGTVTSDPALLERILRNLLSNAVRHTQSGRILFGCRRRSGQIEVQVHDTGPGIAENQQPLIFNEFHQIGNPARDRREGIGLGLAIVDRLAKLLGHPIGVKSIQGRGSTFWINLPATIALPHRTIAPVVPAQWFPGSVIAVIDDDPDIQISMQLLLEGWSYRPIAVGSLEEALEELRQRKLVPDLIIADYRLKGSFTGIQVIRTLNTLMGRQVPGILLTGDTQSQRLNEARAHGFDLLFKPIQGQALRVAIGQALASTIVAPPPTRVGGQGRS